MTRSPRSFADVYRGPHEPMDALHWLDRPGEHGPSGAEPPQRAFIRLADALVEQGQHQEALAVLEVAAELLAHYRRLTLDAIARTHGDGRDC